MKKEKISNYITKKEIEQNWQTVNDTLLRNED